MKISRISFFFIMIISLVATIVAIVFNIDIYTAISVEIFIILMGYCVSDYSKNIFFICFLCSFFIFLISGDYVEYIFDKHYYREYTEEAIVFAHKAICISMISMAIGYFFTKVKFVHEDIKKSEALNQNYENYLITIRKASLVIFYFAIGIMIVDRIYAAIFVLANGYFSYYTSYTSFLPNVIVQLGDFAPMGLCFFLATFPSKKECRWPIRFYLLYAIIGFIVGQRGVLVYNAVFIIGYYLYRNNYYNNDNTVWISKYVLTIIVLFIPFAIVGLMAYGYIREGNEVIYKSLGDTIVNFFVNIGSSSMCIKYAYMYKPSMPGFRLYSFGTLLNYFKYSPLFNWFNGVEQVAMHTVKYALQANNLDAFLSYSSMTNRYLGGQGLGSSFIAELYMDFGYIGIAIGSMVYGFLFKKISGLNRQKWIQTSCQLYVLLALMKTPRGTYGVFVSEIVNVTFIVAIIAVNFLAQNLVRKKYNGKKMGFAK